MFTVAIMGRKQAQDLFGETVEELLIIWIQIILALWIAQWAKKKLTSKSEDV